MSPLCLFLSSTVQDCTDCLAVLSSSGKVQIRLVVHFFSNLLVMLTLLIHVGGPLAQSHSPPPLAVKKVQCRGRGGGGGFVAGEERTATTINNKEVGGL